MPSYLITGTSRGLGLAFATELLKNPENHVIATARNTGSKGLTELVNSAPKGKIDLVKLDILDTISIKEAVAEVSKLLPNGLDVFVSNAGTSLQSSVPFEKLNLSLVDEELHFMVTRTLGILQAFLPLIRKGQDKKIVVVTSALGSIEASVNTPGLGDIYSVARAALNMLVRKWGGALKLEGITTALVHPGWVPSTDIGAGIKDWVAKYAPNTPVVTEDDSAAGVVAVLTGLKLENTNSFYNYDGTKLPW